jgi:excinuclease ABC subunit B
LKRGSYRVVGEVVDVNLAYADEAVRLQVFNDVLVSLKYINPLTGEDVQKKEYEKNLAVIFPAKHYVAQEELRKQAMAQIKEDLQIRLAEMKKDWSKGPTTIWK